MKSQPTSTYLDGWRTARVSSYRHAGLCIGRLQNQAIDHQVLREGDRVRIVVRRANLGDAIALLDDIAKPPIFKSTANANQRAMMGVLAGIPIGSVVGAACASMLGFDTVAWTICGAGHVSVVLACYSALPKRDRVCRCRVFSVDCES